LKGSAILRMLTLALLIIAAPAIFIPSVRTAQANGGTRPVVTNKIVGPYKVQVGIFPGQPRVGNLHLSIKVEDASGEQVLTGATVFTSLTGPPGATSVGLVPATNTPQDPQTYDVDMPLDMIGSWILTLETDSELGQASLDVPLEVVEPEGFDLILLLAGGVAILALVLWIRDRMGKGKSQSGS
jgi:hypothetical protein